MDDLTAKVDEGVVAANGERGDRHSLDEEVRGRHHQRGVLAGTGLRLVGVDDKVARAAVGRGEEAPLQPGREPGAAAATQAGVLGHRHEVGGRHLDGLPEGLVALVLFVGRQGPGPIVVPELSEDRGQRNGHAVALVLPRGRRRGWSPGWVSGSLLGVSVDDLPRGQPRWVRPRGWGRGRARPRAPGFGSGRAPAPLVRYPQTQERRRPGTDALVGAAVVETGEHP